MSIILADEMCTCGHDDSWHVVGFILGEIPCAHTDSQSGDDCPCNGFVADCSQGQIL